MTEQQPIFISRAGADAEFAAEVGRILEAAGYEVVLQQWDFANRNFMDRMHETLASGARVVALLSPEYLKSKHAGAEWQNTLAADPLNEQGRLVVMRVVECAPAGLLAGLAYWDLVPIKDDRPLLREVVLSALREPQRGAGTASGPYWRAPSVILDPEAIRETPSFTGRSDELEAIAASLDGGARTIVYGLGGMGKSSLAREFAWRRRAHYSIIVWLDAEREDRVIEGFIRLGSLFVRGLDEVTDRRRAAQQAKTTVLGTIGGARKPVLLIFDNVASRQLLREWAPREAAHVLATSRNADWGGGAKTILLSHWPLDEAMRYLVRESARDDLSNADARAIAEALGGLPLALAHAAAYLGSLRTVTARSYLAQLERRLSHAPDGAEYPRAVFATFQEALARAEQRQPGAAALLCLAAFFAPDAIPEELLAGASECGDLRPALPGAGASADLGSTLGDVARREEALGALDRFSLIRFAPQTRSFSLHRLVGAAARDLVSADGRTWAECAVASAAAVFPASPDEVATWPRCESLIAHAAAALEALPHASPFAPAARLAVRCGTYFNFRADYDRAERFLRRALALAEACYEPGHYEIGDALNSLAHVLRHTNRPAEAESLYRRTLGLIEADQGAEHPSVAVVLYNLALVLQDERRNVEAEPLLRRALAINEAANGPDHPHVAVVLSNLASVLRDTGRAEEAEALYVRGLAIFEAGYGPDDPWLGVLLDHYAKLLRNAERFGEAEALYRRALRIIEAACGPEHADVATTLYNFGLMLSRAGRSPEAEPLFRRALTIRKAIYKPDHPWIADVERELAKREEGRR